MAVTNAQLTVRVTRICREALDVKSFELAPADGSEIPAFTPGAHIDVRIDGGITRQYSLCNGPRGRSAFLIAVKEEHASRGGSRAMHERVREGDLLQVNAPRNAFPLNPAAAQHMLLGGGIGITPLVSMARHLAEQARAFWLHYFARSREHAAFHDFLAAAPFKEAVSFHYGLNADAVRALLSRLVRHRPQGTDLYICGPAAFMDQAKEAAREWPSQAIHLEHFTAAPALSGQEEAFEVRLARRGGTYVIPPGKSIIAALAEHGIDVDVCCEQGICGTCLTDVLEGTPDHRDLFLTEDEKRAGDKMALCVSRARSKVLVLDL